MRDRRERKVKEIRVRAARERIESCREQEEGNKGGFFPAILRFSRELNHSALFKRVKEKKGNSFSFLFFFRKKNIRILN